jgi:hypothetical protein
MKRSYPDAARTTGAVCAPHRLLQRLVGILSLIGLLLGCLPAVMGTQHPQLLARRDADAWRILSDDDPAYALFEAQVLSDAFLVRMRGVLDGATKGLLAAKVPSRAPQTIANVPCILLDSQETGVMRHVRLERDGRQVRIELALGLGHDGDEDLAWAQQSMALVAGSLLYELMGQAPPASPPARPYEVTTPDRALAEGFAGAIEALHAEANPARIDALRQEPKLPPLHQDRLLRYEFTAANGFRVRFEEGRPTATERSYEEALSTPGVVATFFYRLLQQASPGYPQRYMLWFANFDAADTAYAKTLLAINRMPTANPSLETFAAAYQETFPAERAWVEALARQVLGDR